MNMNIISSEEKDNILENAVSSYIHGVEHLVNYKNGNDNIKFSILHIFNSVELILKAYLGSINNALLEEKIDDFKIGGGKTNKDKTAGVSILLTRMKIFSDVQFDIDLITEINKLRTERNDIEHKKFILEDENEIIETLINVIYGMRIFCDKNVSPIFKYKFPDTLRDKLDNTREVFDIEFKMAIEKVKELNEKGYKSAECPYCLNRTVAYEDKKCRVDCVYCKEEIMILECYTCGNILSPIKQEEFSPMTEYRCDECLYREYGDYDKKADEYFADRYDKELEEMMEEYPKEQL